MTAKEYNKARTTARLARDNRLKDKLLQHKQAEVLLWAKYQNKNDLVYADYKATMAFINQEYLKTD